MIHQKVMTPISVVDLGAAHLFVNARFTGITSSSLKQHLTRVAESGSRVDKCRVTRVVELSEPDYEDFCASFQGKAPYVWLCGQGGSDSVVKIDKALWQFTDEERNRWLRGSWRNVVAVTTQGKATIYVDPSGYDYPPATSH